MHRYGLPLLVLVLASQAHATVDYVPLQEKSQGQSLTGGNVLNDSLFSNPAGSTFTQVYSLDASMQGFNNFAVSILDTKTEGVGGGLAYFRRGIDGARTQGGRMNLATRISDTMGVGASGKYVVGPDSTGKEVKLTDVDLGLLTNFQQLVMGLTLRNALGGNDSMDLKRELALGARFNYKNQLFFSGTAISTRGFSPNQVGFGMEFVSPYYFALKGGFFFLPNTPFQSWTGGLSFISPKLSLHYAVEFKNLLRGMEHQFGMTLLM